MIMKTKRLSGIELLRLFAMFGIVLSHWGGHGSWQLESDNTYLYNKVFLQITQYLGEIGNCIFILITGYFCANKTEISKEGLIRVITDVKVYAFVIWGAVVMLGFIPFTIMGGLKSVLSIIYPNYWFVLPYLAVFMLSPWINLVLHQASNKALKYYLGIMIAIEMLLPLMKAPTISSNVGLFVLLYSLGFLLRTKKISIFKKDKTPILLLLTGFMTAIISLIILDLVLPVFNLNINLSMMLIGRFSFLPVLSAIGLLLWFERLNIVSPIINRLAQSAFAVYLISENPNVYPWFWKLFFDNIEFYNTSYMIPIALLQALVVMASCIFIDMMYKLVKSNVLIFFKIIRK